MSVEAPARLFTAEQLAERWQLLHRTGKPNPSHVYRLTREGLLKAVQLGRYYRYRLDHVEEFEQTGGTKAGHGEVQN